MYTIGLANDNWADLNVVAVDQVVDEGEGLGPGPDHHQPPVHVLLETVETFGYVMSKTFL